MYGFVEQAKGLTDQNQQSYITNRKSLILYFCKKETKTRLTL